MRYRLHHLQLEGVRAKIQQISQKLGGVWEPDCRMQIIGRVSEVVVVDAVLKPFAPPFFSKTFRKTLSGNTFQNPQVKKISEVLFLVFFYVLPDFAKRHVHVYPPCLVNASFALVACLQATIVVAWLLETRRSSRPRLYTPLNTANSHGKSLFLPGKYHQHG